MISPDKWEGPADFDSGIGSRWVERYLLKEMLGLNGREKKRTER